jgi:hypothetical protein
MLKPYQLLKVVFIMCWRYHSTFLWVAGNDAWLGEDCFTLKVAYSFVILHGFLSG